ncbi:MAG: histidinol phosphate phosphatase [Burkholderiales bacterium]|nr:histidinol phosphate phosphatase [Burkholderiales bacterium]
MQLNDELYLFANLLADSAASISRRYFRQNLVIDLKTGNFPVTKVDLEIESTLRQMIKASYPGHTIIGEEYATQAGSSEEYAWVIDPIDGTIAFTTGKPTFTTLIALTKNDKPLLGIIDQPISGERFIGITDIGSYLSLPPKHEFRAKPIYASKIIDMASVRLNATTPDMFTADELIRFNHLKSRVRVCSWGGDAYAYALLASGHIDVIMESQLQYYDVAALMPIITASGGVITTWDGGPITSGFSGQCLASSNIELHNKVLNVIVNVN